ncbi:unnamed protein product [Rhizoctonia solani]|uniref:Tyrosine kinase catalytic domain protein n=1 Tax=Rhizoctonia solani TaxID=456999 RepID=A0A8H3BZU8_9AGAM|nr:unnamed protein product [Rhizoctonia solani]
MSFSNSLFPGPVRTGDTPRVDNTIHHQDLTYFYSGGRLYYYDRNCNVYQEDGFCIHISPSPLDRSPLGRFPLDPPPLDPDFYIRETPYNFDAQRNLVTRGEDGLLQPVHTWKGHPNNPSMVFGLDPDHPVVSFTPFGLEPMTGATSQSSNLRSSAETATLDFRQGVSSQNSSRPLSFNPVEPDFASMMPEWPKETEEKQKADTDPGKGDDHRCSFCGRLFKRPSTLKDHLSVHTGIKRHECPFQGCRKTFSTRNNMRRHFSTHRAGRLEAYELAGSGASSSGSGRPLDKIRPTCRSSFVDGGYPTTPPADPLLDLLNNPFEQPLLPLGSVSPFIALTIQSHHCLTYQRETNPSRIRIGHNTILTQICQNLVDNGCSDMSSKIAHIDTHPIVNGELSDLYQGKLTNQTVVAVKYLRPPANGGNRVDKTLKHTAHELFVWSLMEHHNVLNLLGFIMSPGKLALVIPWVQYRSLLSYIKENIEVDCCDLCSQIAEGLSYVHDLGITHGDLKGDNVAVSEDGTAKITNFAGATMRREFSIVFTTTKNLHYSIRWAAPELFSGISGPEADVYALGMTILEALTGDVPHKNRGDLAIIHAVMVRKELPVRPLHIMPPNSKKGNALWGMLQSCWSYEPASRPRVGDVRDVLRGIQLGDLDVARLDALPMEVEDLPLNPPNIIATQPSIGFGSYSTSCISGAALQGENLTADDNQAGLTANDATMELTTHPELTIRRDTDLSTIINYLVDNGCADVTSQLMNIAEHSKFSGKQSDIYQAQLRDGTAVAVKCLRDLTNSSYGPNKVLKHTAHELYTWSISSHPNILGLIGLAIVRDKLAMVAPWMRYGSLSAYMNANSEADRCNLCSQIAGGLAYMHTLGIAHGDMKGDNVVVSQEGIAKITDFGCATMKREFPVTFTATESLQYSIRWAAPEMFLEDGSSSFETDVYAFGMTILVSILLIISKYPAYSNFIQISNHLNRRYLVATFPIGSGATWR